MPDTVFRWLRCNQCGAEYEMCPRVMVCDHCHKFGLNIISDVDGELPASDELLALRAMKRRMD